MGRKEKLLDKARRTPQSLRFGEFETLMEQCGWVFRRQSGSHRLWYSPSGYRFCRCSRSKAAWRKPIKSDSFCYSRKEKTMNNENYDFDGFSVNIFLDEKRDWVAHFVEMPNISAFGDDPKTALDELKTAWELVKEDYRASGEEVPIAPAMNYDKDEFVDIAE